MKEAARVLQEIQKHADKATPDVRRVPDDIKIGWVGRQGDIYLHRVDSGHPRGDKLPHRQLALGSTIGARHIAELPAICYEGSEGPEYMGTVLLGPLIVSSKRFGITHPEHGTYSLPAGTYQVTHQMDARTRQRIVD